MLKVHSRITGPGKDRGEAGHGLMKTTTCASHSIEVRELPTGVKLLMYRAEVLSVYMGVNLSG
jgi:hypothetical protein